MTQTQSELRQASIRAVTGTTLDYNGDWMALFDLAGIPKGNWDERMLAWINVKLGTTYTNVNNAMQALAAANSAFNFTSMGTFTAVTAAFIPQGVQFHRDISLQYALASIADSPNGIAALWIRGNAGTVASPTMADNMTLNSQIPFGQTAIPTAETSKGYNFVAGDNSGGPGGVSRFNLNNNPGGTINTAFIGAYGPSASGGILNETDQHWLMAWNTSGGLGAKTGCAYLNGVRVSTFSESGTWAGGNVGYSLSKFFLNVIEAGLNGSVFQCAQVFFDVPASMAGILTGTAGTSTIIPAVIAKFYNAGPVDLGLTATPKGSLPLGTQPLIFHDGPVAAWATNLGSLASPTAVGPLAASRKVFAAPINPTQVKTTPYQSGWSWDNNALGIFNDTTHVCTAINYFGNPIASGDIMVMIVNMQDSAGTDRSPVVSGNGTWNLAAKSSFGSGGTTLAQAVYWKVCAAGDVTAANVAWTNTPTISWAAGATLSNACYHLFVYKNATNVVGAVAGSAASTTYSMPGVTATANSLLVNGVRTFDWTFEGVFSAFAANQNLRFKRASGANDPYPWIFDEAITSAGATGGRTWASAGGGNPYIAFSYNVQ